MILNRRAALGVFASGIAAWTTRGAEPVSSTLKKGDKAPDFTLPSTDGGTVHLADYIGKSTVVLAFFPAAFTGG
jgi:peroxiredoxin